MTKSTSKSVQPNFITTLALIVNPACVPAKDTDDQGALTRDNTPWYIILPALGVSLMAIQPDGAPITGYWDDKRAEHYAAELYQFLVTHPEELEAARQSPQFAQSVSRNGKVMYRVISVRA